MRQISKVESYFLIAVYLKIINCLGSEEFQPKDVIVKREILMTQILEKINLILPSGQKKIAKPLMTNRVSYYL